MNPYGACFRLPFAESTRTTRYSPHVGRLRQEGEDNEAQSSFFLKRPTLPTRLHRAVACLASNPQTKLGRYSGVILADGDILAFAVRTSIHFGCRTFSFVA
ncbi:hypothetical protein ACQY0O_007837 [Thecaphora frezii]